LNRGELTRIRYYRLDTVDNLIPRVTHPLPVTLGIRALVAATHYRDNMVYRLSEVEVGFYPFDRWVEPPEEMVTHFLSRALERSGLFQQISSADEVRPPAWILSGEVTSFDEIRDPEGRRALCGVRLALQRARDDRLVWSGFLSATAALAQESPTGLAEAMTRAVQEVAIRLIRQLEQGNLQP
jgi:ABC-type uncharacterized transport system auxiliary subunit